MKLKSLLFACTLCIGAVTAMAQEKIEWLTIKQAQEQARQDGENAKKYFVDCYTDWCGWCKRMDRDTFSDTLIAKILNHYYYPVKFNAESREKVELNGKVYENTSKVVGRGGTHSLAYYLLNNRMSYPSFSIMNKDCKVLIAYPGYHEAKEFELFLVFMGEFSDKMSFETFVKDYESKYRQDILKKINTEKK